MKYDYLVVGAGLFGAVFAHEAKEAGKKVLVIDKRNHIAGNVYTSDENGIAVHKYGAHIFHTSNKEVWDYVNRFASFNNYINSPVAVYKDELYNLPFNMNTFSKMWNVKTPKEAAAKIEEQKKEAGIENPQNLEEQAISMVGRDIYEKLIEGYTGKQWGRKCSELPASIIKRLPVRMTYDNNYFTDRYQGIPEEGYTKLVENLLEGIDVKLGISYQELLAKISKVEVDAETTIETQSAGGTENKQAWKEITFDKVVYTGMIDEFYDYKLGQLQYRSLRFEEEYLPDEDNYQGNAVVNYTEYEVPYTRIIEHKHFAFNTCKGTVITKEYPASWKPGDEPFYPIVDDRNTKLYEEYKKLAEEEPNIIFGGRLGQYKYFDMDKVIAEALKLAREEFV